MVSEKDISEMRELLSTLVDKGYEFERRYSSSDLIKSYTFKVDENIRIELSLDIFRVFKIAPLIPVSGMYSYPTMRSNLLCEYEESDPSDGIPILKYICDRADLKIEEELMIQKDLKNLKCLEVLRSLK